MSASLLTKPNIGAANAGIGALLLAAVSIAVGACTNSGDSTVTAPSAASTRPACQVVLPDAWQQAFADSTVDTGGASTHPLAVGPAGEVAAKRSRGDTRELLLIGPDKSVTEVYPVPSPDRNSVDFVTMDDRWIVVGLERDGPTVIDGERYSQLSTLTRIDVIDRRDDSVRTVVESPEAEHLRGGMTLDSIALFADTVYWITHNRHSNRDVEGILRSYDLKTGVVAEVATGVMRDVRSTAVGIAWWAPKQNAPVVVRNLAPLPAAIAAEPGIEQDQSTLVTDGTRFAWIIDAADGGTGIGLWSPDTGLTRINTVPLSDEDVRQQSPLHLAWPYVVFDEAVNGSSQLATIVDTRSGALALIQTDLVDAGAGTIATDLYTGDLKPGLVRTDALPPLSC